MEWVRQTESLVIKDRCSVTRTVSSPHRARTPVLHWLHRRQFKPCIDVAKAKVDVAVRPTGERWEVPRDEAGIPQLVSEMKTLGPSLVLLEATGGLELPLVAALAAEALPVVVVNPRQVRDFARAIGKLAKTDALDAAVLAHFAEAIQPPVRPLRDAETQELNSWPGGSR